MEFNVISVAVFALLALGNEGLSSDTCESESCESNLSHEESSSCGCSVSRKHTENEKTEARGNVEKEHSKYTQDDNDDFVAQLKRNIEMVHIPKGSFIMGTNKPIFIADGEGPERQVSLNDFYLDKYEVSNAEFQRFVKDTKYQTEVRNVLDIDLIRSFSPVGAPRSMYYV